MNKQYFQELRDAAEFQALSYEAEARACLIRDEPERNAFYIRMADSSRDNAKCYQSMMDDYDKG